MNRLLAVPAALLVSLLAACSTGPSSDALVYDGIGPDTIDSVDKRERFDKAVLPLEFKNQRVTIKPGFEIASSKGGSAAAVTRGTDAVNLHARDVATVEFVNAIRMNPRNADAYFGLGNAVTMRGKTGEAIAAYATALELRPDDLQQRLAVVVLVLLRLERRGQQVDQCRGHRQLLLGDLDVRHRHAALHAQLVRVVQRLQHQRAVHRPQRAESLLVANRDLRDRG